MYNAGELVTGGPLAIMKELERDVAINRKFLMKADLLVHLQVRELTKKLHLNGKVMFIIQEEQMKLKNSIKIF